LIHIKYRESDGAITGESKTRFSDHPVIDTEAIIDQLRNISCNSILSIISFHFHLFSVISDPTKDSIPDPPPTFSMVPTNMAIIQKKNSDVDNRSEKTQKTEATELAEQIPVDADAELAAQKKEERRQKTLWFREKAKTTELAVFKFIFVFFYTS